MKTDKRSIAFITCSEHPGLCEDDRLLLEPCRQAGLEVAPVIWDDASVDWTSYDACVIRSTWDYCQKLPAFERWIEAMHAQEIPLHNPPRLLKWNLRKTYLRDLQAKNIPIIPTLFVEKSDQVPRLQELLEDAPTLPGSDDQFVIKQIVSAGGYQAWKIHASDALRFQSEFDRLVRETGALVQPYVPEVKTHGEWALLYYNGEFSHAVLKKPAAGEFRVQEKFGGNQWEETPPAELIEAGKSAIEAARKITGVQDVLYTRVDGVVVQGRFRVMELEMLEPSLFLLQAPAKAQHAFAQAINRLLK